MLHSLLPLNIANQIRFIFLFPSTVRLTNLLQTDIIYYIINSNDRNSLNIFPSPTDLQNEITFGREFICSSSF